MFRRPSVRYGRTPEPGDALSESGASLGRAYRLGAGPGEELAADGVRFADPVGGLGAGSRLAVGARHRHALGRAGRSASARRRRSRPRHQTISRPRRRSPVTSRASSSDIRGLPVDPIVAAPAMAARLRLHHRSRRRRAQRFCPHQRSLRQCRQDADLGRGLQRHPRLA